MLNLGGWNYGKYSRLVAISKPKPLNRISKTGEEQQPQTFNNELSVPSALVYKPEAVPTSIIRKKPEKKSQ
jgi:hypothetical protein